MIADDVRLGSGVVIHQPGLVNLYGCAIGDSTRVGAFVEIQRGATIGRNCKIDEGAHIVDSVIWPGVTIDADAKITGSIVGKGCMIGHSAVLNPGAVLGDKTVVTDFSIL